MPTWLEVLIVVVGWLVLALLLGLYLGAVIRRRDRQVHRGESERDHIDGPDSSR